MNKNFPFCQITVRLHLQKINQVIVSPEFSLNIVLLLYFTNPVQCPVIQYKPVKSKSKLLNIMQKLIPLTPRTKGFQQGSYTQRVLHIVLVKRNIYAEEPKLLLLKFTQSVTAVQFNHCPASCFSKGICFDLQKVKLLKCKLGLLRYFVLRLIHKT